MSTENVQVRVGATGLAESIRREANRAQAQLASKPIRLNLDTKGFRQPLGRITHDVSEFNKSMDASVARVLAFGAAMGVINAITNSLKAMVNGTVKVEKALKDVNVILNLNNNALAKFGDQLFDVARKTSQSFDTVSEAAVEFARQGLGAAETLKRINDAMILSRLSGLKAAESVSSLTAAVNSYAKAGISTTQVINRMANVDAAFAVSSADLANAIQRAGASAQGAKVEFNELLAAVTSVQQQTARGGAVIGNAFKSIFTRMQRSGVRETLENLGVATENTNGSLRSGITVLRDYAKIYKNLTDQQKAYTDQQIAGLFQINNLKALLSDLTSEYSVYDKALRTADSSTNQAIQRNEELNKTLSSLLLRTGASIDELAAKLGELGATEGISKLVNMVKGVADFLNDILGTGEGEGNTFAKNLVKGIGGFLTGPGLVIIGAALAKIFGQVAKFGTSAFKEILGLNVEAKRQESLQKAIGATLSQNEKLYAQIMGLAGNTAQQEQVLLNYIRQETKERLAQEAIMKRIASSSAFIGVGAGEAGFVPAGKGRARKVGKKTLGMASGFVPNFRRNPAQSAEYMGMVSGGYSKKALRNPKIKKTKIHDGKGQSFWAQTNGAENIKTFSNLSGKKATMVVPEKQSDAYKAFSKKLKKKMAASGFVPNFAKMPRNFLGTKASDIRKDGANRISTKEFDATNLVSMLVPDKGGSHMVKGGVTMPEGHIQRVRFMKVGPNKDPKGRIKRGLDKITRMQLNQGSKIFANLLDRNIPKGPMTRFGASEVGTTAGRIFEKAAGSVMKSPSFGLDTATFDFIGGDRGKGGIFDWKTQLADAKSSNTPSNRTSMAKKTIEFVMKGAKGWRQQYKGDKDQAAVEKIKRDVEKEVAKTRVGGEGAKGRKVGAIGARRFGWRASGGYVPSFFDIFGGTSNMGVDHLGPAHGVQKFQAPPSRMAASTGNKMGKNFWMAMDALGVTNVSRSFNLTSHSRADLDTFKNKTLPKNLRSGNIGDIFEAKTAYERYGDRDERGKLKSLKLETLKAHLSQASLPFDSRGPGGVGEAKALDIMKGKSAAGTQADVITKSLFSDSDRGLFKGISEKLTVGNGKFGKDWAVGADGAKINIPGKLATEMKAAGYHVSGDQASKAEVKRFAKASLLGYRKAYNQRKVQNAVQKNSPMFQDKLKLPSAVPFPAGGRSSGRFQLAARRGLRGMGASGGYVPNFALRTSPMKPPSYLVKMAEKIHAAGGKAQIIGGAPRDHLLGMGKGKPKDWDVEVFGLQEKALRSMLGKNVSEVGKDFGVFKVNNRGADYDFSMPRAETSTGRGHRDFKVKKDPFMSELEAAKRRDLTVNAISYNPLTKKFSDAGLGGMKDLEAKVMRPTSAKFMEDPLRVMRAMQFAGRFGFSADAKLIEYSKAISGKFNALPKERVRDEWYKWATKSKDPSKGLDFLEKSGWMKHFPELGRLSGIKQSPKWHPEGNVFEHTKMVVDQMTKRKVWKGWSPDERWKAMQTALTHDFGKFGTTIRTPKGLTSAGHAEKSVGDAEAFFQRIMSKGEAKSLIKEIGPDIGGHMYHTNLPVGNKAIGRMKRKGMNLERSIAMAKSDVLGRGPQPKGARGIKEVRQFEGQVNKMGVTKAAVKRLVTGNDLKKAGLMEQGPGMKPVLNALEDAQLSGQFSTTAGGLKYAKRHLGLSGGYVPNFGYMGKGIRQAINREQSMSGQKAVVERSRFLDGGVGVYNKAQQRKYGSLDRTIQRDHLGQGQRRSTLGETGSGKERYAAGGFVPNFRLRNIFSRNDPAFQKSRATWNEKTDSYLEYINPRKTQKWGTGPVDKKTREIAMAVSRQKGDMFEIFKSAKNSKFMKEGGRYTTQQLGQQMGRKINPKSTNFENLVSSFPQLKYRMQRGLHTSGTYRNESTGGLGRRFSGLSDLRSYVNSLSKKDFQGSLGKGAQIRINDLETKLIKSTADGGVYSQIGKKSGGYIPNFAGARGGSMPRSFGLQSGKADRGLAADAHNAEVFKALRRRGRGTGMGKQEIAEQAVGAYLKGGVPARVAADAATSLISGQAAGLPMPAFLLDMAFMHTKGLAMMGKNILTGKKLTTGLAAHYERQLTARSPLVGGASTFAGGYVPNFARADRWTSSWTKSRKSAKKKRYGSGSAKQNRQTEANAFVGLGDKVQKLQKIGQNLHLDKIDDIFQGFFAGGYVPNFAGKSVGQQIKDARKALKNLHPNDVAGRENLNAKIQELEGRKRGHSNRNKGTKGNPTGAGSGDRNKAPTASAVDKQSVDPDVKADRKGNREIKRKRRTARKRKIKMLRMWRGATKTAGGALEWVKGLGPFGTKKATDFIGDTRKDRGALSGKWLQKGKDFIGRINAASAGGKEGLQKHDDQRGEERRAKKAAREAKRAADRIEKAAAKTARVQAARELKHQKKLDKGTKSEERKKRKGRVSRVRSYKRKKFVERMTKPYKDWKRESAENKKTKADRNAARKAQIVEQKNRDLEQKRADDRARLDKKERNKAERAAGKTRRKQRKERVSRVRSYKRKKFMKASLRTGLGAGGRILAGAAAGLALPLVGGVGVGERAVGGAAKAVGGLSGGIGKAAGKAYGWSVQKAKKIAYEAKIAKIEKDILKAKKKELKAAAKTVVVTDQKVKTVVQQNKAADKVTKATVKKAARKTPSAEKKALNRENITAKAINEANAKAKGSKGGPPKGPKGPSTPTTPGIDPEKKIRGGMDKMGSLFMVQMAASMALPYAEQWNEKKRDGSEGFGKSTSQASVNALATAQYAMFLAFIPGIGIAAATAAVGIAALVGWIDGLTESSEEAGKRLQEENAEKAKRAGRQSEARTGLMSGISELRNRERGGNAEKIRTARDNVLSRLGGIEDNKERQKLQSMINSGASTSDIATELERRENIANREAQKRNAYTHIGESAFADKDFGTKMGDGDKIWIDSAGSFSSAISNLNKDELKKFRDGLKETTGKNALLSDAFEQMRADQLGNASSDQRNLSEKNYKNLSLTSADIDRTEKDLSNLNMLTPAAQNAIKAAREERNDAALKAIMVSMEQGNERSLDFKAGGDAATAQVGVNRAFEEFTNELKFSEQMFKQYNSILNKRAKHEVEMMNLVGNAAIMLSSNFAKSSIDIARNAQEFNIDFDQRMGSLGAFEANSKKFEAKRQAMNANFAVDQAAVSANRGLSIESLKQGTNNQLKSMAREYNQGSRRTVFDAISRDPKNLTKADKKIQDEFKRQVQSGDVNIDNIHKTVGRAVSSAKVREVEKAVQPKDSLSLKDAEARVERAEFELKKAGRGEAIKRLQQSIFNQTDEGMGLMGGDPFWMVQDPGLGRPERYFSSFQGERGQLPLSDQEAQARLDEEPSAQGAIAEKTRKIVDDRIAATKRAEEKYFQDYGERVDLMGLDPTAAYKGPDMGWNTSDIKWKKRSPYTDDWVDQAARDGGRPEQVIFDPVSWQSSIEVQRNTARDLAKTKYEELEAAKKNLKDRKREKKAEEARGRKDGVENLGKYKDDLAGRREVLDTDKTGLAPRMATQLERGQTSTAAAMKEVGEDFAREQQKINVNAAKQSLQLELQRRIMEQQLRLEEEQAQKNEAFNRLQSRTSGGVTKTTVLNNIVADANIASVSDQVELGGGASLGNRAIGAEARQSIAAVTGVSEIFTPADKLALFDFNTKAMVDALKAGGDTKSAKLVEEDAKKVRERIKAGEASPYDSDAEKLNSVIRELKAVIEGKLIAALEKPMEPMLFEFPAEMDAAMNRVSEELNKLSSEGFKWYENLYNIATILDQIEKNLREKEAIDAFNEGSDLTGYNTTTDRHGRKRTSARVDGGEIIWGEKGEKVATTKNDDWLNTVEVTREADGGVYYKKRTGSHNAATNHTTWEEGEEKFIANPNKKDLSLPSRADLTTAEGPKWDFWRDRVGAFEDRRQGIAGSRKPAQAPPDIDAARKAAQARIDQLDAISDQGRGSSLFDIVPPKDSSEYKDLKGGGNLLNPMRAVGDPYNGGRAMPGLRAFHDNLNERNSIQNRMASSQGISTVEHSLPGKLDWRGMPSSGKLGPSGKNRNWSMPRASSSANARWEAKQMEDMGPPPADVRVGTSGPMVPFGAPTELASRRRWKDTKPEEDKKWPLAKWMGLDQESINKWKPSDEEMAERRGERQIKPDQIKPEEVEAKRRWKDAQTDASSIGFTKPEEVTYESLRGANGKPLSPSNISILEDMGISPEEFKTMNQPTPKAVEEKPPTQEEKVSAIAAHVKEIKSGYQMQDIEKDFGGREFTQEMHKEWDALQEEREALILELAEMKVASRSLRGEEVVNMEAYESNRAEQKEKKSQIKANLAAIEDINFNAGMGRVDRDQKDIEGFRQAASAFGGTVETLNFGGTKPTTRQSETGQPNIAPEPGSMHTFDTVPPAAAAKRAPDSTAGEGDSPFVKVVESNKELGGKIDALTQKVAEGVKIESRVVSDTVVNVKQSETKDERVLKAVKELNDAWADMETRQIEEIAGKVRQDLGL